MNEQEQFFNEVTKDWTAADWEDITADELRCHIDTWVSEGGDLSDGSVSIYRFEKYMGWA